MSHGQARAALHPAPPPPRCRAQRACLLSEIATSTRMICSPSHMIETAACARWVRSATRSHARRHICTHAQILKYSQVVKVLPLHIRRLRRAEEGGEKDKDEELNLSLESNLMKSLLLCTGGWLHVRAARTHRWPSTHSSASGPECQRQVVNGGPGPWLGSLIYVHGRSSVERQPAKLCVGHRGVCWASHLGAVTATGRNSIRLLRPWTGSLS